MQLMEQYKRPKLRICEESHEPEVRRGGKRNWKRQLSHQISEEEKKAAGYFSILTLSAYSGDLSHDLNSERNRMLRHSFWTKEGCNLF